MTQIEAPKVAQSEGRRKDAAATRRHARRVRSAGGISIDNVVGAYKVYAPLYDVLFGAILEPGRTLLTERVGALGPAAILEIGVGTGLLLERYPSASTVVGIDVSEEMLKLARERAAKLNGRGVKLYAMDAENMSFEDESFDCVTLPYVLSVTPRPEALVSEARRVCRKGGAIFILNHFSGSPYWWFLEQAMSSFAKRIGFRSTFTFEEQILKYDWQVESVQDVNLLGLSKLVVIRN